MLVNVKSVGLNFRDVLNVLGMYPGDPGDPGGDCAGTIAAVGSDVGPEHRCALHSTLCRRVNGKSWSTQTGTGLQQLFAS